MESKKPIIAVIGSKKTGKTALVELLIKAFTDNGLKIATAKHISLEDFSLDRKGTDTWRHYKAGAKKVISVSNAETAVLNKDTERGFSMKAIEGFTENIDLLLLEGFSECVAKMPYIGKIICVKDGGEIETYNRMIEGEIITFCSLNPINVKEVLVINKNKKKIVTLSFSFFNKRRGILKTLDSLPRIDCKKCGYQTCEEMANAIYNKELTFDDCDILRDKERSKIKIEIDSEEVSLNPFVSNMVYEVTISMLKSLKRAPIETEKRLLIKVS